MDTNLKSQFFHCMRWLDRYQTMLRITLFYKNLWTELRDDPERLKRHEKHCTQSYHANCGNSIMEGGYLAGIRSRDCCTYGQIDQIIKYWHEIEKREESMVKAIQLDLATIKGLLKEKDINKLTRLWEIEYSSDII